MTPTAPAPSPPDARSSVLRHRTVRLVGASVVVVSVLWLALARMHERQLRDALRHEVRLRVESVCSSFQRRAARLERTLSALAAFGEKQTDPTRLRYDFDLLTTGLGTSDSFIRALQIFPETGGQLTYPLAGNEAVQGITLAQLLQDPRPEVRSLVQDAIARRTTTLSRPLDLRQGGRGLIARRPIFRDDRLWGMATLVLDLHALVEPSDLGVRDELRLTLHNAHGDVLLGTAWTPAEETVSGTVTFFGETWTFAATPAAGWDEAGASSRRGFYGVSLALGALLVLGVAAIGRRQLSLTLAVEARTRELAARAAEARRLTEEAQAARAESEAARLRITETLAQISDGFALIDREGRYLFVNPRLADYTGRPAAELVGRSVWEIFPAAVGTAMQEAFERAMTERCSVELEHFYPPFKRWFQHRLYPSPTGLTAFSRDITGRKEAEQAREANDKLFREFVTRAPLPLGFVAHDGSVRFLNEQFTRLFGYSVADIPTLEVWWQRAFPDAIARTDARARWLEVQQSATPDKPVRPPREIGVTCRDGSVRHVEVGGTLVHAGYLAAFYDVTARRQAEENAAAAQLTAERHLHLAERSRAALLSVVEDEKRARLTALLNEERYRSFVEASFDWIWEIDTRWRFTFVSAKSTTLLGFTPEELLGRTPIDLVAPEDRAAVRARLRPLILARRPVVELESRVHHRDGRTVLLETNSVPFFAADGTWLGYRGINRDITARRAAERTLRLHSTALEAAANAVVITDRTGRIEWANQAFTALSGWTLAEAAGRSPGELIKSGVHGPDFFREMWATLVAGGVWSGEIVNRRKDGAHRTEHMTITPVRDGAGGITHFVAIKQDITDRKLLERHFLQAQRVEAIGTLAGGIAHDLNNILAPVLMISGLIKPRLNDEDRELLSMVESNCRRGAEIVKQLLAFSRGQAGERIAVQPRHLIKEMLQIMRETFPREIALDTRIDPGLHLVNADPTQLHQVLLNLCVNARDAMPRGGTLTVTAGNVLLPDNSPLLPPRMRPGLFVVIAVNDTGSGIAPEIRHRIFDPFFTTKEIGKGTGLGLPTVLGIVQSHGGFIVVDSVPGQGASFKVHLPATPVEAAATAGDASPTPPLATGAGETILVVDDEAAIRDSTRALLEANNYQVLTAAHGEEALNLFVRHRARVALVLTDLMMPVMNGPILIRTLRQLSPGVPLVATTGLGESADQRELRELGVEHVVLKPFEPAHLLALFATLLRRL